MLHSQTGDTIKHAIDVAAVSTGVTVGINEWVIPVTDILNPILTAIASIFAIIWAIIRFYEYLKVKRSGSTNNDNNSDME